MMRQAVGALTLVLGLVLAAACGMEKGVPYKATQAPTSVIGTVTVGSVTTATGATMIAAIGTAASAETAVPTSIPVTVPAPPATDTPTPGPAGTSGIAGTVTIGPTCPVQRIDSPCPDRPYEAQITIWQGGVKVAETRSAADGKYFVELPPGSYRVVGESPGTLPRGSEQDAVVEARVITAVDLQYDSGIR
jgi:hypothetical protein